MEDMKKILTKTLQWLFPICAAFASVFCIIRGLYALSAWPILAATLQILSHKLLKLSEDAIQYGDAMMLENLELSSKLCDAETKIVELQKEIIKLKQ